MYIPYGVVIKQNVICHPGWWKRFISMGRFQGSCVWGSYILAAVEAQNPWQEQSRKILRGLENHIRIWDLGGLEKYLSIGPCKWLILRRWETHLSTALKGKVFMYTICLSCHKTHTCQCVRFDSISLILLLSILFEFSQGIQCHAYISTVFHPKVLYRLPI